MTNIKNPFDHDKKIKIIRRNKVAKNYKNFNFLKKRSAKDLIDKIKKFDRKFDSILEIGSHTGEFTDKINIQNIVKKNITSDISFEMMKFVNNNYKIIIDENKLPFKDNCFDGIFSCIYLVCYYRTVLQCPQVLIPIIG